MMAALLGWRARRRYRKASRVTLPGVYLGTMSQVVRTGDVFEWRPGVTFTAASDLYIGTPIAVDLETGYARRAERGDR